MATPVGAASSSQWGMTPQYGIQSPQYNMASQYGVQSPQYGAGWAGSYPTAGTPQGMPPGGFPGGSQGGWAAPGGWGQVTSPMQNGWGASSPAMVPQGMSPMQPQGLPPVQPQPTPTQPFQSPAMSNGPSVNPQQAMNGFSDPFGSDDIFDPIKEKQQQQTEQPVVPVPAVGAQQSDTSISRPRPRAASGGLLPPPPPNTRQRRK